MKKERHISDIKNIVSRVEVEDYNSFSILGHKQHVSFKQPYLKWNKPINTFGTNISDSPSQQSNALQQLAYAIYSNFYMMGRTDHKKFYHHPEIPSEKEREIFMENLTASNSSTGGYDLFWTVYTKTRDGQLYAQKNGQIRQLIPNEFVPVYQGQPIDVNSQVHVKVNKESKTSQPTFYHVFSDELMSQQSEICRFYFHLKAKGATILVSEITQTFNKYAIPYNFKCANHKDLYDRADSAVLYLEKQYVNIGIKILALMIESIKPILKEAVPLFTKKLYRGISFAEDPGNGMSFGMSRCMMIAEGLLETKGNLSQKETVNIIVAKMNDNGINIDHPYLNSNSCYPYNFSPLIKS